MIQATRRKFFGLAAVLPVAASEAATKMGLKAITDSGYSGLHPGNYTFGGTASMPTPMSWVDQVKKQIAEFWNDDARQGRLRQAAEMARILDADLAAMRSLSPSSAYQIQIGRNLKTIEAYRKNDLDRELKRAIAEQAGFRA